MDRANQPDDDPERARLANRAAEFSLVRGGPFERIQRALGLVADRERYFKRRAVVLAAVTWLPPFALAKLAGRALFAPGGTSFATQFDAHIRSLVAIPILLWAETFIDERFAGTARQLITADILDAPGCATLDRLLTRAERWRDARAPAVGLAAVAVLGGVLATRYRAAARAVSWLTDGVGTIGGLSPAGWWYALVSLPVYQFLLAMWLWRWALWCWLLARFARLRLALVATNPDRAAGLEFLGGPSIGFGLVIFAASAVASGSWAHVRLYDHTPLATMTMPAAALAVTALVLTAGPLVLFTPTLYAVRHRDSRRYGELSQRYVRLFDRAWCEPRMQLNDAQLSAIQTSTLTDLVTSVDVVRKMKLIPFGVPLLARIGASGIVPMLPLVFTEIPAKEILRYLAKALF